MSGNEKHFMIALIIVSIVFIAVMTVLFIMCYIKISRLGAGIYKPKKKSKTKNKK